MAEVSVERRFRGSVRLVTLHLWKVARSTDIEEGFAAARAMGMLNDDRVAFVRRCMALDAALEEGRELDEPITADLVHDLQMCALCLNEGQPA